MCSITQNTDISSVWRRLRNCDPVKLTQVEGSEDTRALGGGEEARGYIGAPHSRGTESAGRNQGCSGDAYPQAVPNRVASHAGTFASVCRFLLLLFFLQLTPHVNSGFPLLCHLSTYLSALDLPFIMTFPLQLPPLLAPISGYPGDIPEKELHWPRCCTSHSNLLGCLEAEEDAPSAVGLQDKATVLRVWLFGLPGQVFPPVRSEIYLKILSIFALL